MRSKAGAKVLTLKTFWKLSKSKDDIAFSGWRSPSWRTPEAIITLSKLSLGIEDESVSKSFSLVKFKFKSTIFLSSMPFLDLEME